MNKFIENRQWTGTGLFRKLADVLRKDDALTKQIEERAKELGWNDFALSVIQRYFAPLGKALHEGETIERMENAKLDEKNDGLIVLTDERVLFVGRLKSEDIRLSDISSVKTSFKELEISTSGNVLKVETYKAQEIGESIRKAIA